MATVAGVNLAASVCLIIRDWAESENDRSQRLPDRQRLTALKCNTFDLAVFPEPAGLRPYLFALLNVWPLDASASIDLTAQSSRVLAAETHQVSTRRSTFASAAAFATSFHAASRFASCRTGIAHMTWRFSSEQTLHVGRPARQSRCNSCSISISRRVTL